MAEVLSGSLSTNVYDGQRWYEVTWSATQDISSNISTISWNLYSRGSSRYAERTVNLRIDGNYVYSKSDRIMRGGNELLASGSINLGHWSDGTRYFAIELEVAVYSSAISVSGSNTFTLQPIGRSSEITGLRGNVIGKQMIIDLKRSDLSFVHQMWYRINNSQWYDGDRDWGAGQSGYDMEIPFTISNDKCWFMPNISGNLEVCIRTYSKYDGRRIGNDVYKSFTIYVDRNSVYPVFWGTPLMELVNENSIVNKWGVYLQGYSKYRIKGSVVAATGSSVKKVEILDAGYSTETPATYWEQDGRYYYDYTSGYTNGDKLITIAAVDSRGVHTDNFTFPYVSIIRYYKPTIKLFDIKRQGETIADVDSSNITICTEYDHAPVIKSNEDLNVTTAKLLYKKQSDANWTTYPENIPSGTPVVLKTKFDNVHGYDFKLEVKDSLYSKAISQKSITTKNVLMNFSGDYNGLGVGKICESNGLEIGLDTKFFNPIYLQSISTPEDAFGHDDFRNSYVEKWHVAGCLALKYQNGVMVLSQEIRFPLVIDKQDGSLWYGEYDLGNFKFPFKDVPYIVSVANTSNINFWYTCSSNRKPLTNSQIGSVYFYRNSQLGSTEVTVNVTAIGLWK